MLLPFLNLIEPQFDEVNAMIVKELHSDVDLVENIGAYIVEGGGKRLRPVSVLLSALGCKNSDTYLSQNSHIKLACIIEFIHTATLLHDDVVDMSNIRRGRDTANAKWGNSPTVLVGDFLYSRAFQLLVQLELMPLMNLLANTTNVIAEGEVQQLLNAGNAKVTEADYMDVIRKKTAILFQAACEGGAMVAGGAKTEVKALSTFGHHLGMAFQLQDDLLDYIGDESTMGKNVGDDLGEGKPTLPLIYTMTTGKDSQNIIRDALVNKDSTQIDNVIALVESSGGISYTMEKAQWNVREARNALESIEDSPYRMAMQKLADFAVKRKL